MGISKVKCVKAYESYLTVGQVYDVTGEWTTAVIEGFYILDDEGERLACSLPGDLHGVWEVVA